MKILQIVKTSKGANWAFEQAKWLNEHNVEVVTVIPDKIGDIAKKYIQNKMKIIISDFSLPISNPLKFFERKKRILEIVNQEKPDIIHMHFVTNVLMVRFALRKIKIPRLFQVPGPLHLESNIFRKLDIKSANEFDFWAPSCKKSEEIYLKEGISSSKVFLAYYGGYGGNTVEEYSESKNILHMQYNIPKENILIGMVSYFYKPKWYLGQTRGIKGHEDFIDAIEILNKTYKNITGIIMGGPWGKSYKYEEKIKKYVQDKKIRNIIFTGFRKDTKQIYRELNIVVHPSHSENLGGAAESLAAGVPTIATNIGGFPDIVIDGKTGYLCECKNPKSIANCVNKILNDKQKTEQMTVSGRETIKNLLDIENTAIRMKMIYQKILKRDKKSKNY